MPTLCAIRINPYISEVRSDPGRLYESYNNQISVTIDAYACAAELGPNNPATTQRLQLLCKAQNTCGPWTSRRTSDRVCEYDLVIHAPIIDHCSVPR